MTTRRTMTTLLTATLLAGCGDIDLAQPMQADAALEPTKWQELLDFASQQGVDWAAADEAYWGALADRLSDALGGLNLKVPQTFMVTTTGLEEFNFAYVRNQSVVLPRERASLDGPVAGDERTDFFLLAHEFFHLLSGENPAQRQALYALLGRVPRCTLRRRTPTSRVERWGSTVSRSTPAAARSTSDLSAGSARSNCSRTRV